MVPFGHTNAAIADVVDMSYDADTGVIRMQLDVVEDPHVFNQFAPHDGAAVHAEDAHYHYATRPGMKIDAQAVLKALKDSGNNPEGEITGHSFHLCQEPNTHTP